MTWQEAFGEPGVTQDALIREQGGILPMSVLDLRDEDRWHLPIPDELLKAVDHRHDYSFAPDAKATRFNSGLCRFLIRYYTKPGDSIFDPFAGWGTRAYCAMLLGRSYLGLDIAKSTVDAVQGALSKITQATVDGAPIAKASVYLGDGIAAEGLPDASFDALLTCPPYHDREIYEESPDRKLGYQLSRVDRTYFEMFMRRGFLRWHKLLKPSALAIVVASDWREDGAIYPFLHKLEAWAFEAGFLFHDFVINRMKSYPGGLAVDPIRRGRFAIRAHETVLVFRKEPVPHGP